MPTDNPCKCRVNTLYTLSLHMYDGEKIILGIDIEEKTGKSDHCPEGTECPSWFFRISRIFNIKALTKLENMAIF